MSDTESMSLENEAGAKAEAGAEVDQQALRDLEEEFENLPHFGDTVIHFQPGDELYPYH